MVETEPIIIESYRKKRICVDEGRASSADAATLHSAAEHAGPTREDTDERVESNITLMWKATGSSPKRKASTFASGPRGTKGLRKVLGS